ADSPDQTGRQSARQEFRRRQRRARCAASERATLDGARSHRAARQQRDLACASRSRGIGTRTSRKMVRRGGGGLAPISIRSARNFRKLFVTSRARRTIWLTRLRHLNSKQCHLSHQAAIYLRASIRFAAAQSPNSDRGSSGTQARSISAPSSIFSV